MIPLHDRTTYSWNSDIVGIHSIYWHMRIFTYIAHYKVHYFDNRFTLSRREYLEHFALFRLVQPSNLSILNIHIRCAYVHTVAIHTYVYTVYISRTKGVCMYVYCVHTHTYVSVRGYVRVVATVWQVNECVLCAHVCLF